MATVYLSDINKMQEVLDAASPGDVIEIPRGTQTVTVAPQKTRARMDMFAFFIVRVPNLTIRGQGYRTKIRLEHNPTDCSIDAPCLFYVYKGADNCRFENMYFRGECRQRFGGYESNAWRHGSAIYSYQCDGTTCYRVWTKNWQTHIDMEWGKYLTLRDCTAMGVCVAAAWRFNRATDFIAVNCEGRPYTAGEWNPGIDRPQYPSVGFSMGLWVTPDCQGGLIENLEMSDCKNEALIVEGLGISDLRINNCDLSNSTWGFASRGMNNSLLTDMRISDCWRCGIMLNASIDRDGLMTHNVFRNNTVHNCGNRREDGFDNWSSIYEGKRASGNTFEDNVVTFDDPGPWPSPEKLINLKEES
jgi:hypothetical protein